MQARPIPRRAHKKSKLGCRTCKIRKVKCDERRPLCRNCERHFTNLARCDFDDHEPVLQQDDTTSSVTATIVGSPVAGPAYDSALLRATHVVTPGAVGRLAEPLRMPRAVAPGRLDPFEARPASVSSAINVDVLMNHYLADFAYRSFPFYASRPLIELWWPFVREDQLLFHVVLLLSSLDRSHLQSNAETVQSRELLGQCLQLLTIRVQDPVASVNDHTIVSIACLAAMEHDKDNMKALSMHLEGLKRVISLRGGLETIRTTNPMVANVTFWLSMISVNEPQLLPLTYGDSDSINWLHARDTATLLTHDGSLAKLEDFGVDLPTANVLHEVQRLSKLYTAAVDYGTPHDATHVLSHLCSIVDRLLQMSKDPSDDSPVPGLSQSCRIAGVLHVLTPQAGYFPNPTLLLHTLTRDLKSSLSRMIRATGTKSHLLLWLLAVGGITAHSMPERTWFVGHLVVVITDLRIRTWDDMRRHLVQLAFHDNFCDISFKKLWTEIRAKQQLLLADSVDDGFNDWCGNKARV